MSFVAVAIGVGTAAVGMYSANKSAKAQQSAIDQQTALANRPQRTALGSYFNPGGTSGMAPGLQSMQTGILDNLPGYKSTLGSSFGTYQDGLAGARSEFVGNESPFMQSVLNPIKAQGNRAIGDLTQSMGRRGIAGSSIANTQIANTRSLFGRQLGDATAQARTSQVATRLGIDEAMANSATNYVSNLSSLDQSQQSQIAQIFAQEMQQLGLNQQAIQNMLATTGMTLQNNQNKWDAYGRSLMAGGGMIAQGASNWGGGGSNYKPMTDPDFGPY